MFSNVKPKSNRKRKTKMENEVPFSDITWSGNGKQIQEVQFSFSDTTGKRLALGYTHSVPRRVNYSSGGCY